MAGKNKVTLTFAGELDKSLERSIDDVGKGTKSIGDSADEGASGLNRLEEAGGTTETRFLGLGAGISGVSTLLSGDLNAETAAMAMADLGDAVEHTVAPMLKHAQQWVTMGATAVANGARMAAAWLVGLGPVGLVIAAVGAVIGILALLGVRFDDVKRAAASVFNWIKSNWPLLLAILTGPIGLAVLAIAKHRDKIVSFFRGLPGTITGFFRGVGEGIVGGIKSVWNNTIGGFGFTFGGWDPPGPGSIPGFSFRIPRLHSGGEVPGAPGQEVLAVLQAGEHVSRRGGGGGPSIVVNVAGSIRSDRELVRLIRDELGRGGMGGVL